MISYYLYYYNQLDGCRAEANIWCWTDWVCKDVVYAGIDAERVCPAQYIYGCGPGITPPVGYCDNNPTAITCRCRLCSVVSSPGGPGTPCPDESYIGKLPTTCPCAYTTLGGVPQTPGTPGYALCNNYLIPYTQAP